jgi:hypothetical protein
MFDIGYPNHTITRTGQISWEVYTANYIKPEPEFINIEFIDILRRLKRCLFN